MARTGRNGETYLPGRRVRDPLQVISIVNFKGGSSKTTTAIHLAQRYALRGYRVLAIDMDPQASLTTMFGYRPEIEFAESGTVYDALRYEDPVPLSEVVRKTCFPNLDLAPSGLMLSEYVTETAYALQHKVDPPFTQRLAIALDEIERDYDLVIIDCPPQLGFSARLRWSGYHNGAPNGLWYIAPEQLSEIFQRALEADVQVHTHTNGDQATQLVLDLLQGALRKHPHPDHRFTLQHCQLADAAQFRKAAKLGMCANLFANHHMFWGDEHYAKTVGPDRALQMNACRTALDSGVPLAIHSDAPVTPLSPLFTAWAAVNRITASGRTQGEHEKITVTEALRAITLGAAYTLHLDGDIGSIETGKKADFAVLDADPTACDPTELKDIPVWGTVQGGRIFAANAL